MISVVIPFYNNFTWLEEAIESVFNQSYKDFEIIVVNDGSPENDRVFLSKYSGNIIYHHTTNKGPASARNLGINIAKGEYIAFLDSDDLWEPDKLEKQLAYMEANNLVWSHTGYSLFDDASGKLLRTVDAGDFHGDVFINCLVSSPIATPCVMVRRDFLANNPDIRFSESMRYGQDGFLWLNIARYQPLGVVPEALSKVRIRGGNAALRARVYLKIKSQLWGFIKNKKAAADERYNSLPFLIRCGYRLSSFNDRILSIGEDKLKFNKGTSEKLAKALYLPSYLMLKLLKYTIK